VECAQNSSFGAIWNLAIIEDGIAVIFDIKQNGVKEDLPSYRAPIGGVESSRSLLEGGEQS